MRKPECVSHFPPQWITLPRLSSQIPYTGEAAGGKEALKVCSHWDPHLGVNYAEAGLSDVTETNHSLVWRREGLGHTWTSCFSRKLGRILWCERRGFWLGSHPEAAAIRKRVCPAVGPRTPLVTDQTSLRGKGGCRVHSQASKWELRASGGGSTLEGLEVNPKLQTA